MPPQQGTFIKNQKGGDNLRDESNFTYRKHRSNKEKTKSWYKCVKIDTLRCPAVAVWNHTTSLIDEVQKEHNHSTDLLGDIARTHESRMVESAVAVGASGGIAISRKVKVSLERAGVPEATAKMKKSGALRTALHRKKVEVMGWSKKVPTTASEIMAEDALPVQLTKTLTGREFLRFKGYTDTAEQKVCYCT
jgi:hypothetical protein